MTVTNLAEDASSAAVILDNWVVTKRGVRLRKGSTNTALLSGTTGKPMGLLLALTGTASENAGKSIGMLLSLTKATELVSNDIVQMFEYRAGGIKVSFAATAQDIFNITSPPAPPITVTSSLSGLVSGDWVDMMHTTPGGSFLVIANGSDAVRNFDGATWTEPAITGVAPEDLSFVWLFKNREFFIQKNTMDAWYLPVNSIAGGASVLPLGGVMQKGGTLLAGFTWSVEAGDGFNDMCCFMSSEGEVAVYAGTDPSDADKFALRGVYNIGKPLGKHAIMEAGGDVLIGVLTGLIPMSQAFNKDRVALQSFAVSQPIEDLWLEESLRRAFDWQIKHWPDKHLAYVSFPHVDGLPDRIFVVNTLTGGWSTHSGWAATCWGMNGAAMQFGSTDGKVFAAELGGDDDGEPFLASYLGTFQSLGDHSQTKSAKMAAAQFLGSVPIKAKLFVNSDYDFEIPIPVVATVGDATTSNWDSGIWGTAIWDGESNIFFQRLKQNVRAEGSALAVGVSILVSGTAPLDCELLLTQGQFEPGEKAL